LLSFINKNFANLTVLYKALNIESCSYLLVTEMNIQVPESLGEVLNKFDSTSDKHVIVLPKRVVDPYNFERGSVKLLKYLSEKYGLELTCVDGASSRLNVDWMKSRSDREKVALHQFETSVITGLEYLMITTDIPMIAQGIEDRDLYIQSKDLIEVAQASVPTFNQAALSLRKSIQGYREACRDPSLALDVELSKYEQRQKGIDVHFNYLQDTAESLGIDVKGEFPNFYNATRSFNNPYGNLGALRERLWAGLGGSSTPKSEEEPILSMKVAISRLAWTNEEAEITAKIRETMAQTKEQKDLCRLYNNLNIMISMANMQADPSTVDDFKKRRHEFSSVYFKRALDRYGYQTQGELQRLDSTIPVMERFFELTGQRSSHFIDKTLEAMDKYDKNLSAMSFAGFLAPGVVQELGVRNIPYTIVMTQEQK